MLKIYCDGGARSNPGPAAYGFVVKDNGGVIKRGNGYIGNLPKDWKYQFLEILNDLKDNGVEHRDIKPDNLMVKDGVIKLIDFGWARFKDDPQDTPPSCLGYPYKPSWGFDDNFSLRKVLRELEYQKGELLCAS